MHSRDNSIPQNHHSRRRRVTAGGDAEARPRLASANRGPLPSLAWADVERITHGQLGRTISTVCPFCSHTRRTANQRKAVFAIKLKAPDFAIYNCAHCGESGYVHSERSSRVVDLGKRQPSVLNRSAASVKTSNGERPMRCSSGTSGKRFAAARQKPICVKPVASVRRSRYCGPATPPCRANARLRTDTLNESRASYQDRMRRANRQWPATPLRRTAGRRSSYSGIQANSIWCNAVQAMT